VLQVLLATPCPEICDPVNNDSSFKKPWFATLCILAMQFITNGAALLIIHILRAYATSRASVSPGPGTPVCEEADKAVQADGNNVKTDTTTPLPDDTSTPVGLSPVNPLVGDDPNPPASDTSDSASGLPSPDTPAQALISTPPPPQPPVRRRRTCAEWVGLDIGMEWPMFVITVLDLITVFLQSLASLYIPASINSAMRGTLLLITGGLSRVLRVADAQAGRLEWLGIWISTACALGIGATHIGAAIAPEAAGTSSSSSSSGAVFDDDPARAGWGLFFSLLSNFTLALGIVYETKVFEKRKPSPLLINCIRTGAGAVILLIVLTIGSFVSSSQDHGRFENGSHTMCCLTESPKIDGLSVTLGLSSSISGISALYLSVLAGSNFRALVYVGRALFVWFLQLVVYYLGEALADPFAPVYGRPWTLFSYPQAVGFVGVLIGGAVTWRGKSKRMKVPALPAA
jgi:hypothetical protein